MPVTYEKIATNTLGSNTATVTFSSIPSTYTDLMLIISASDTRASSEDSCGLTFNTDTSTASTNYSYTVLQGDGTSATSSRQSNYREIDLAWIGGSSLPAGNFPTAIAQIMNYANTTTYKTVLNRGSAASTSVNARVGLWRSTAAISTITLWPGYNGSGYNFITGSTFTLYGIKAA